MRFLNAKLAKTAYDAGAVPQTPLEEQLTGYIRTSYLIAGLEDGRVCVIISNET